MPAPRAVLVPAAVLALALAGCGGGDDAAPAPTDPSTTVTAEPTATASPSAAGAAGIPGVAADADVSDLLCARDGSGAWTATGAITNPTSAPADYRITVVVGAPDGGQKPGRRLVLPQLQPGKATAFTVDAVPVGESATPTCRVQVVRLR
ncbi:hypothetical protein [Solicola sp. PLA-1-18]|uniref:hypothetical protein n=1 Tax=Solicola sp. PLA-1-18 TaxID=3380532 RepID=UPI003B79DA81